MTTTLPYTITVRPFEAPADADPINRQSTCESMVGTLATPVRSDRYQCDGAATFVATATETDDGGYIYDYRTCDACLPDAIRNLIDYATVLADEQPSK